MSYNIEPIGMIRSPYKEKFAVPLQPGLVPSARSEIVLQGEANALEAVRGLEQFSHLWLLFLFDQNLDAGWRPTVRPPRLGGNERIGVFASRATFRPNGIGMSAVEFKGIRQEGKNVIIELGGVDLVDKTPIVDIKPYIPYSDSVPQAEGGFATEAPQTLDVVFSTHAASLLQGNRGEHQKTVISEVLAQDPRPAYKKGKTDTKEYAVHLFNFNIRFTVNHQQVTVTALELMAD